MQSLEISARTVEEAIDLALEQLGVSREQVEVVVLQKGKSGLLGIGAEEARIRVSVLPAISAAEAEDAALAAKEVVEMLLALMKVPATVDITQPPVEGAARFALDIQGEDLGTLIGRRGLTLAALQYITNIIVAHRLKVRLLVVVDVAGYKQRRYKALQALALRMAERVQASGQSVTLEPMLANERRIVHLALADHSHVITRSVGEGEARKVTILAKRQTTP